MGPDAELGGRADLSRKMSGAEAQTASSVCLNMTRFLRPHATPRILLASVSSA